MSKPTSDADSLFANFTAEEQAAALSQETTDKSADKGKGLAYSLSGLAVATDGSLKKSKYLSVLSNSLDSYTDIELTPDEAKRIRQQVSNFSLGSMASMPVICTGDLCPWRTRCVFWQIQKAPVGRSCLLELNLMKQWQMTFLEAYDVDVSNLTEISLVNELVEIELFLNRTNMNLSFDQQQAGGISDVQIGFDREGNVVTQKQVSQIMEFRERLLSRKHKVIKLLVGDRQEKYKKEAALKQRDNKDPSSSMAQLKEQMEHLQRQLVKVEDEQPIPGKVIKNPTLDFKDKPLNPDDIVGDG